MTPKIKRIIAVEGLIFLCVFPALVSVAVWSNSSGNNPIPGRILLLILPGYLLYLMIRSAAIANSVFPKTVKHLVLKEALILGSPILFAALFSIGNREFSNNEYLRADSPWKNIADGIGLSFIIIIPAYIIRFVIWAIKTLRGK